MQEAPYLHANGSGYLPEVMREVSETYRAAHGDRDTDIAFDVVPVRTWQQLLARARTSRWVSTVVTANITLHWMMLTNSHSI